jgi:hypothetical protein
MRYGSSNNITPIGYKNFHKQKPIINKGCSFGRPFIINGPGMILFKKISRQSVIGGGANGLWSVLNFKIGHK